MIAEQPHLRACALAAGGNWQLLAEQARRFGVGLVAIADEASAGPLRQAVGAGVTVLAGPQALAELVGQAPADMVLSAVVGACGVRAALAAIGRRLPLAIANKETLVVAGRLITSQARRLGVPLLPVDSEHAAIRQCLGGRPLAEVRRVIITASGGPFRTWPAERIARASIAEALNHPTWEMGRKITIDSATMMNKALEVIEAHWLFGLSPEQIEVVIHPESIVHSAVEFRDGSMLAQLSWPDMMLPITQALNDPDTLGRPARRLDLFEAGKLTFEPVDPERFPAVGLAWRVLAAGRGAGAVLNGANEAAVKAFLDGRIHFADIVRMVEQRVNCHGGADESDLDALLAADQWARAQVEKTISSAAARCDEVSS